MTTVGVWPMRSSTSLAKLPMPGISTPSASVAHLSTWAITVLVGRSKNTSIQNAMVAVGSGRTGTVNSSFITSFNRRLMIRELAARLFEGDVCRPAYARNSGEAGIIFHTRPGAYMGATCASSTRRSRPLSSRRSGSRRELPCCSMGAARARPLQRLEVDRLLAERACERLLNEYARRVDGGTASADR